MAEECEMINKMYKFKAKYDEIENKKFEEMMPDISGGNGKEFD